MAAMHTWDESTELFAHSVIGYAIERLRLPKDPRWGSQPAEVLEATIAHAISAGGAGAHEAMRLAGVFLQAVIDECGDAPGVEQLRLLEAV